MSAEYERVSFLGARLIRIIIQIVTARVRLKGAEGR